MRKVQAIVLALSVLAGLSGCAGVAGEVAGETIEVENSEGIQQRWMMTKLGEVFCLMSYTSNGYFVSDCYWETLNLRKEIESGEITFPMKDKLPQTSK